MTRFNPQDPGIRSRLEKFTRRGVTRVGRGGDQSKRDGARPFASKQAATQAGLSEHQAKQAVRVANVPDAQFEAAVEGDQTADAQFDGATRNQGEDGADTSSQLAAESAVSSGFQV